MRLAAPDSREWSDRAHFMAVAAAPRSASMESSAARSSPQIGTVLSGFG